MEKCTKTHLTALWCCPLSLKSWTLVFIQTAEYSQGIPWLRLHFWTSHYFYSSFGWILGGKKEEEKKKCKDWDKLEQKGVIIKRNFLLKKTISQVCARKICWFWLTHHIHTSLEVKSGGSDLILCAFEDLTHSSSYEDKPPAPTYITKLEKMGQKERIAKHNRY